MTRQQYQPNSIVHQIIGVGKSIRKSMKSGKDSSKRKNAKGSTADANRCTSDDDSSTSTPTCCYSSSHSCSDDDNAQIPRPSSPCPSNIIEKIRERHRRIIAEQRLSEMEEDAESRCESDDQQQSKIVLDVIDPYQCEVPFRDGSTRCEHDFDPHHRRSCRLDIQPDAMDCITAQKLSGTRRHVADRRSMMTSSGLRRYATVDEENFAFLRHVVVHIFDDDALDCRILDTHVQSLCHRFPDVAVSARHAPNLVRRFGVPSRGSSLLYLHHGRDVGMSLAEYHPRTSLSDKWNENIVASWLQSMYECSEEM